MKKQLFFDDNKLFAKDNVVRKYGRPVCINTYSDMVSSNDHATGFVFRLEDGRYRMLYTGHNHTFQYLRLFSAISDDGVHFSPELINESQEFPHEVMMLPDREVGFIYEDLYCDPCERYKMLISEFDGQNLCVRDLIYTSPDLLSWSEKEGAAWGDGAEPLVSVFYNKHRKVHTIMERPFWGIRYSGFKETTDWYTYSEYQPCLNVDSLDEDLCEIYGTFAFEYEGMYIGLPHLYRRLKSELNAKYLGGCIDTQLAYSYDGRYWNRSLREPFVSGLFEDCNPQYKMTWCFGKQVNTEGDIYLYASATELEHGEAFGNPGTGKMMVFQLRQDGFVSLASNEAGKTATIATREKIWHSGEPCFNLIAEDATVAVYQTDETVHVSGNLLGFSRLIEGMGHEDCIPFSGDSKSWTPTYKSGKKVSDYSQKTLVFELKFKNGEVFSFAGDYTDAYNTQGARYRKYGIIPD